MVHVQTADFDAAALQAALRQRHAGRAGAIATFVGLVRDHAPGQATHSLFLDHYPGMCESEIQALCQAAAARWQVLESLVVHRVGELALGEQIVFVGVASAHRRDAFQACEFLIDALKTRAPFWKRETLADGRSFWVQQAAEDARRAVRWNTAPAPSGTTDPHER